MRLKTLKTLLQRVVHTTEGEAETPENFRDHEHEDIKVSQEIKLYWN